MPEYQYKQENEDSAGVNRLARALESQHIALDAQADAYEKYTLALVKILQMLETGSINTQHLNQSLTSQLQEVLRIMSVGREVSLESKERTDRVLLSLNDIEKAANSHHDIALSAISKMEVHSSQLTNIANMFSQQNQRLDQFQEILTSVSTEQTRARQVWSRARIFIAAIGVSIAFLESLIQLGLIHVSWSMLDGK